MNFYITAPASAGKTTITAALLVLFFTSCGGRLTRTEWEKNHPWCKPIAEIKGAPGEPTRVVYPDNLPSQIPTANGRAPRYSVTPGVHILHVRGDTVVAREWQNSVVLP